MVSAGWDAATIFLEDAAASAAALAGDLDAVPSPAPAGECRPVGPSAGATSGLAACSMSAFSLSVCAVKARTSRPRASETRCSSSNLPTPRLCMPSAPPWQPPQTSNPPEELIAAAAGYLAVQDGEQHRVVRPGFAAYPAGLPLGRGRTNAKETQIQVIRRYPETHLPYRVEIAGLRTPDLNRGAVGQQSESAVPGRCADAAPCLVPDPER